MDLLVLFILYLLFSSLFYTKNYLLAEGEQISSVFSESTGFEFGIIDAENVTERQKYV